MDLMISLFHSFIHQPDRGRMPLRWPRGISNRGRPGVADESAVTIGDVVNEPDIAILKQAIAACPSVQSMLRVGRSGGTAALEMRLDAINSMLVPILRTLIADTPSFI